MGEVALSKTSNSLKCSGFYRTWLVFWQTRLGTFEIVD